MEKETVEGLHLGATLILLSATLAIGVLIFWYARTYSGDFFNSAAEQNQRISTLELESISTSGIIDVPMAAVYTVISREWRAISEVSVFNKNGTLITTGTTNGQVWSLSNPLTKADGTSVTKLAAPEQVVYAADGGVYTGKISGRAFVTVTLLDTTKTYSVQIKLQQ